MDLGIDDFHYSDLYDHSRLNALARSFDAAVEQSDGDLFRRFDAYRVAMQSGIAHGALTEPQESELLISVARHLGAFLAQLFRTDPTPIKTRTQRDSLVARFKKEFVQKRVAKVASVAPHPALRATLSPLTRGEGSREILRPAKRGEGARRADEGPCIHSCFLHPP